MCAAAADLAQPYRFICVCPCVGCCLTVRPYATERHLPRTLHRSTSGRHTGLKGHRRSQTCRIQSASQPHQPASQCLIPTEAGKPQACELSLDSYQRQWHISIGLFNVQAKHQQGEPQGATPPIHPLDRPFMGRGSNPSAPPAPPAMAGGDQPDIQLAQRGDSDPDVPAGPLHGLPPDWTATLPGQSRHSAFPLSPLGRIQH